MENRHRNIREINKDRLLKNANTRERKKRLLLRRIKAGILLAIIVLVFLFILLMTPLFNIRTIAVSGNNAVSISQIDSCVGSLVGKNLTRVSKADVMERLSQIAYIQDCEISKKFIPATLYIDILENTPAAYMNINGKILVLDDTMTVIDDTNSISLGAIPQILGVDNVKYRVGEKLKINDTEKFNITSAFLAAASETGVISKITKLDVGNALDITFYYEDRLTVKCGTSLELERKIRMFKETVTNASMNHDAIGTIDLTKPGEAIYTPQSTSAEIPRATDTEEDEKEEE